MKDSAANTEAGLEITTLGGLEVRLDGRRVDDVIPGKASLMLVHLADAGGAVRRSTLAGLLWSDLPEDRARANLRLVVTRLRGELGEVVTADRGGVWLTAAPDYDVALMKETGAEGALSLYGGDFLEGVEVPGAPLFDEWAANRRATIRREVVASISDAAQQAFDDRDMQQCVGLADKLLELDEWDESIQRLALRAIAETRGGSAALARFHQFSATLTDALGVEPEEATAGLARSLADVPRQRVEVIPETAYAQCGDMSIAYQVFGDGDVDIVVVPSFVSHLDLIWSDEVVARWLGHVASFARVVLFDKLGTGLSDPVAAVRTLDDRVSEIEAVVAACGMERPVIFGMSEGAGAALMYAALHPHQVLSLVLFGSFARMGGPSLVDSPDITAEGMQRDLQAAGWPEMLLPSLVQCERLLQWQRHTTENWGDGSSLRALFPNHEGRDRSLAVMERSSASPGMARATLSAAMSIDVTPILSSVAVPTLVIHARDDLIPVQFGRFIAESVPDATLVELVGSDHAPWLSEPEEVLDQIELFLTGEHQPRPASRILSTVVFSDVVDSTRIAAEAGDARWRALHDDLDMLTSSIVTSHDGRVIKSLGDGHLMTFSAPTAALRAAADLVEGAGQLGLSLRVGGHTGEVEVIGEDVAGLTVNIAARIASIAAPAEVLVSRTVCDLVVGSRHDFADRGSHVLQGVPGEWQLFAIASASDVAASHRRALAEQPTPGARTSMTIVDRVTARTARRSPEFARRLNRRFG